jgi:hypothetical protein
MDELMYERLTAAAERLRQEFAKDKNAGLEFLKRAGIVLKDKNKKHFRKAGKKTKSQ